MTAPRPTTAHTLDPVLQDYGAGLRAELTVLRQIDDLSKRERPCTKGDEAKELEAIGLERERLVAILLDLERHLKPLRSRLAEDVALLRTRPGFEEVSRLHQEAAALVSAIMTADEHTLRTLRSAEDVRRSAAQVLDAGEATLAAYRRSVSPAPGSAGLVDQVG